MMKKILVAVISMMFVVSLTACGGGNGEDRPANLTPQPEETTSTSYDYDDSGSGMGVTYGGKLGFDMGGGLVMPMDGSGLSMGYGF